MSSATLDDLLVRLALLDYSFSGSEWRPLLLQLSRKGVIKFRKVYDGSLYDKYDIKHIDWSKVRQLLLDRGLIKFEKGIIVLDSRFHSRSQDDPLLRLTYHIITSDEYMNHLLLKEVGISLEEARSLGYYVGYGGVTFSVTEGGREVKFTSMGIAKVPPWVVTVKIDPDSVDGKEIPLSTVVEVPMTELPGKAEAIAAKMVKAAESVEDYITRVRERVPSAELSPKLDRVFVVKRDWYKVYMDLGVSQSLEPEVSISRSVKGSGSSEVLLKGSLDDVGEEAISLLELAPPPEPITPRGKDLRGILRELVKKTSSKKGLTPEKVWRVIGKFLPGKEAGVLSYLISEGYLTPDFNLTENPEMTSISRSMRKTRLRAFLSGRVSMKEGELDYYTVEEIMEEFRRGKVAPTPESLEEVASWIRTRDKGAFAELVLLIAREYAGEELERGALDTVKELLLEGADWPYSKLNNGDVTVILNSLSLDEALRLLTDRSDLLKKVLPYNLSLTEIRDGKILLKMKWDPVHIELSFESGPEARITGVDREKEVRLEASNVGELLSKVAEEASSMAREIKSDLEASETYLLEVIAPYFLAQRITVSHANLSSQEFVLIDRLSRDRSLSIEVRPKGYLLGDRHLSREELLDEIREFLGPEPSDSEIIRAIILEGGPEQILSKADYRMKRVLTRALERFYPTD